MPIRNKDGTINFEVLHNCYPELEKVVEAGERWHEHDYECATHRFAYGDLSYCSCGLKEFTAALAALKEKEGRI